ncbi:hypothetical protein FHW88_005613 [Mucilaginibacter sp. SG538B]|uniref:FecR family protein n=1 Tax=Mucilaginibacter sp. SG538B TaxID=2587021 RepID=UPI00159D31E8|nr:FecR family protein [Mucilaginibacter sp. SG538B]NVM67292.1 hypothetical protein [Mucilaginibacter sp. SG538B]
MSKSIPEQFFEKLKKQQLTEHDHLELTGWLRTAPEEEVEAVLKEFSWYFQDRPDELYPEDGPLARLIEKRLDGLEGSEYPVTFSKSKSRILLIRAVSIAASLLLVGFSYFFFKHSNQENIVSKTKVAAKIVPGGNKAMLTLADGSVIMLDSAKNGILASQNNVHIYKKQGGQLVYDASNTTAGAGSAPAYNIISTPRGGQYQVTLPDGSKVWLNAESSLKFPAHFAGNNREVQLSGEGYFEVAKDKKHPFRVSVNHMNVEVLGTHFNVMGYRDESATQTTLLEGAVKVVNGTDQQMIVPGEQASVSTGIKVAKVRVDEVVEWKNGNFNFSHEDINAIMRKIARWYDVGIEYQGKTTTVNFVGTIPRASEISEVLNYLQLTGLVHFKIKDRRIIVMQ